MDDWWIKALLIVLGCILADIIGVLVWAINRWMLGLIVAGTHLFTITIASSHNIPAAVLTIFTPGFAQAYWIGSEWSEKGTFWHPLSYMCAALLVSVVIELTGRRICAKDLAAVDARR